MKYRPDAPFDADRDEVIAAIRSIQSDMALLDEWVKAEQYPTIPYEVIRYLAVVRHQACELTPILTRH